LQTKRNHEKNCTHANCFIVFRHVEQIGHNNGKAIAHVLFPLSCDTKREQKSYDQKSNGKDVQFLVLVGFTLFIWCGVDVMYIQPMPAAPTIKQYQSDNKLSFDRYTALRRHAFMMALGGSFLFWLLRNASSSSGEYSSDLNTVHKHGKQENEIRLHRKTILPMAE
jgi:hypothetical protein